MGIFNINKKNKIENNNKIVMSEDFNEVFKVKPNDYLKTDEVYHDLPVKIGLITMNEKNSIKYKNGLNHIPIAINEVYDPFL